MHSLFSNVDSRLRPRVMQEPHRPISGPPEYPVNPHTFPELYDAFENLQRSVGAAGYRLVILDDFGGAGADWHRKLIGVGTRKLNAMSFSEVVATAAHEFGHIYRHANPNPTPVGPSIGQLSSARAAEVDADRLGTCLMGEIASSIGALRHGGVSMDAGLPVETRIEAVESFALSECPAKLRSPKPIGR